jgi:hypothetical protein
MVGLVLAATGCVSGPIPNGPPPDPKLTAAGYTESEYFLSGVASAYTATGALGTDGHWTATPTTTAPYRTRLIVRRPSDPAKFNGTVLVEWLNVSSGADLAPTYLQSNAELLRDGYAWVGVSAQKIGVDALKTDPRYSSLSHPGDDYSYDIFTQAGRAIRSAIGLDPLGGLKVQHVLATGESQSAFRLTTYVNAINPLVHVYDGFLLYSRGSGAAPVGGGVVPPGAPVMRTDQSSPIIDVQTEGDLIVLRSGLARQPDDAHFRLWEVAGGSHVDEHTLSGTFPPNVTTAGSVCQYRVNSADTFAVVSGAVRALDLWVRGVSTPAHAPRIAVTDLNAADPISRNSLGMGQGGIRLPDIQVPIAQISGLPNLPLPGGPAILQEFCKLFGRTVPFPDGTLPRLYATHETYVQRFDQAAGNAVADGYILQADANALEANAAVQPVPTG